MKWWMSGAALALALPVCAVEQDATYQKTFPLGGTARKLMVENINGPITISGDSSSDVRVTVHEHLTAETADGLAQARNEVRVEMRQEGSTVRIYLDGPFRDSWREQRHRSSYGFQHAFEIQVPRDIDLVVKTVNAGKGISIRNVRGNFDVHHVNGGIEMSDIAGSGAVETVNGKVAVSFVQNPRQASSFKTLNGTVDVAFQPDLAADLHLSVMHGEAWTDFEYQPVALAAQTETRKDAGGFRYRLSTQDRKLRVGTGGVEHSFKTMNGSLKIRKYGK